MNVTQKLRIIIFLVGIILTDLHNILSTDEPGFFDLKKNRPILPVHHIRKGFKLPHEKKRIIPNVNNTKVVGMIGTPALLKCYVTREDSTVIWVKHDNNPNSTNVDVLTVNTTTLVDDKRFLVTYENKMWTLHVRFAKYSDQGLYECQVCNSPTYSIYINLFLFEVRAVILGPSVKEVYRGFPIRLSCILNSTHQHRMKRPTYMFWYHENRMINYDLKDGAVVREGRLGTELIFQRALAAHKGNYSCVPSNARQASVQVIVLPEELYESNENKGTVRKKNPPLTLLLLGVASCVYR